MKDGPGVNLTFVVQSDPPREISVEIPHMKAKKHGLIDGHRAGQEVWSGRRRGEDGRWVQRDMVIDRDSRPPFKWHRVVDEESGKIVKDQAVNLQTSEVVDLRSEPRPSWLPETIRYERPSGVSEYAIAPDGATPRNVRILMSEADAEKLGRELVE